MLSNGQNQPLSYNLKNPIPTTNRRRNDEAIGDQNNTSKCQNDSVCKKYKKHILHIESVYR